MQPSKRTVLERVGWTYNETRPKIANVAPEEIQLRLTRSFCDGSEFRGKALSLFPALLLPNPYKLQLKILETTGSE